MAVPPPILPPEQNTARAVGRMSPGVARSRAGLAPVQRVGTTAKASSSGGAWVVVEPEADITAKGHAYISFDPAGTYP